MADYLYSIAIQAKLFHNNMAYKTVWQINEYSLYYILLESLLFFTFWVFFLFQYDIIISQMLYKKYLNEDCELGQLVRIRSGQVRSGYLISTGENFQ